MISILIVLRNDSVRQIIVPTVKLATGFQVARAYNSAEVFFEEVETKESPQMVLLYSSLQTSGLHTLMKLKTQKNSRTPDDERHPKPAHIHGLPGEWATEINTLLTPKIDCDHAG